MDRLMVGNLNLSYVDFKQGRNDTSIQYLHIPQLCHTRLQNTRDASQRHHSGD